MKVYLDNCCFNRPFDDQSQLRIRLDSEAKLEIQSQIREGILDLVWSYMIDFENEFNPFEERKARIAGWKPLASATILADGQIAAEAHRLVGLGLKNKDSLHLACAKAGRADVFFTTDDHVLKKRDKLVGLRVENPVEFITEGKDND